MYIKNRCNFPSFIPFRATAKPCMPNNFDLMSRSFDENVLRRIKVLNRTSDSPLISLSWLSQAVDFLSSTNDEAQALITNLWSSTASSDDTIESYLDSSVKLLDICNSISSEIEHLRQRRLHVSFVVHLLKCSGTDYRLPAPDKLQRVSDSLSNWENSSRGYGNRRTLQAHGAETLIRDLVAAFFGSTPRRKISGEGKVIRRTVYAVGVLTVFVAGVTAAAFCGLPGEIPAVGVPAEFLWADSFNDLRSTILGKMKRRFSEGEKKTWLLEELDDVEKRVMGVRDAVNGVVQGDKDESNVNLKEEKIGSAVKELEAATERFSNGLDRLGNNVNGMFHTVLRTRNGTLQKYRNSHGRYDQKQLK